MGGGGLMKWGEGLMKWGGGEGGFEEVGKGLDLGGGV